MFLHKEIEKLKKRLSALGAIVEERVHIAVTSVELRDSEIAQKVIDFDREIDMMEVELEEECLKVLALHQPVAIDLRVIVAIMKINNDLERIGDLAVDIAQRGRYFATHKSVELPFNFPEMSQQAREMLQKSLDALVTVDIDLAKNVCAADDAVDILHLRMFRQIENAIQAQPQHVEQWISYLSVSRCLERIADHATNIAEDVIYLAEGQIVRHRRKYAERENFDR